MNLDYEWGVIQGRYPYRWTIWVCNFHPWEVDRLHLAGPYPDFPLADLLHHPSHHTHSRDF